MKLLVVGFLEYDSGKTSLVLSLLKQLRKYNFIGVKPVAGHSIWHQYVTVSYSLKLGILVGEDAYKIANLLGMTDMLPLLNPVDLLISPKDPYISNGEIEKPFNVVLMRVSNCQGNDVVSEHYICEDVVKDVPPTIRHTIDMLRRRLIPRPKFTNLREVYKFLLERAGNVADTCLKKVYAEYENVVIESFNNAATPTPLSLDVDYVIAVSPGKVYVYDGEKYAEAINVMASVGRFYDLRVNDVVKYVKPLKEFNIMPRAEKYDIAYNEVAKWFENLVKRKSASLKHLTS